MVKKSELQDKQENNLLAIEAERQKQKSIYRANLHTSSIGNAVCSLAHILKNENVDLDTLAENIARQQRSIENGKTIVIEDILITQAQTLDALFHFAVKIIPYSDTVSKIQIYSDLASKANNACRKTLLALNQIKNPSSATFIKQQNNAHNQQINQGNTITEQPQVSENSEKKPRNELLTEISHATLDISRTVQTSGINSQLETLEKSGRKE